MRTSAFMVAGARPCRTRRVAACRRGPEGSCELVSLVHWLLLGHCSWGRAARRVPPRALGIGRALTQRAAHQIARPFAAAARSVLVLLTISGGQRSSARSDADVKSRSNSSSSVLLTLANGTRGSISDRTYERSFPKKCGKRPGTLCGLRIYTMAAPLTRRSSCPGRSLLVALVGAHAPRLASTARGGCATLTTNATMRFCKASARGARWRVTGEGWPTTTSK